MIGTALKFLSSGVVGKVVKGAGQYFGAQQANVHSENMERLRQAGSFVGEGRTWWDSLVDGINRLVRPCFTFGTLGLFWLAVDNPTAFAQTMNSLALVPDALWIILGTIIVFWFGEKKINGLRRPKPPTVGEVAAIIDNNRKLENTKDNI